MKYKTNYQLWLTRGTNTYCFLDIALLMIQIHGNIALIVQFLQLLCYCELRVKGAVKVKSCLVPVTRISCES